ncbi:MAG: 5'-nucleotidase [Polaribacter sp.]|nr:5'-nucleotidase [Polaribacter sp.]
MKRITLLFSIFFILLSCKKETHHLSKITSKTIAIDSTLVSNNQITKTIAPYKKKMVTKINTVLSYSPKSITRTDGELESSLGNLLGDLSFKRVQPIFYKKTGKNIHFALFNYGGIRASISKGNVSNKNAFNLMPFENNYVVVELSGEKMIMLIDYLIKSNKAHPLSKQFRLLITKNGYTLSINNKPFDSKKSYFVLTTNYLQAGGDNMYFFKNPIKLYSINYKMRHAIIDEFKSTDTLKSNLDGRFKRN